MLRRITVNGLAPELVAKFIRSFEVKLGNISKGELDTVGSDGAKLVGGPTVIFSSVFNLEKHTQYNQYSIWSEILHSFTA